MSDNRTPVCVTTARNLTSLHKARAQRAADAGWNETTYATLRALWNEGHVASEIGRLMGKTKNAIIGKAHRLKLPARPPAIKRRADLAQIKCQDEPQRAGKVTLPALASLIEGASRPSPVLRPGQWRPAAILSSDPCSYPTTMPDGRHRMICEGLAERGKPYCTEHAALCFKGPQMRVKTQDKLAARHG